MNNFKRTGRIGQTLAGLMLTITIAFSGSLLLTPQTTHAATSAAAASDAAASTAVADAVIATGEHFIGVPYVFGAQSGRTSAFDCSSFTQYVFGKNGIELPRSSRQQAKSGSAVAKADLQAGDLVFSDTNHDGVINHVSIYIGDGKLLHTYKPGIGVTVSEFKGSAWDHSFVTARRVIPNDGQHEAAPADPTTGNTGSSDQGDANQSSSDQQNGHAADNETANHANEDQ